jgi:hypothetical protein
MIIPILAKMYIIVLQRRSNYALNPMEKEPKAKMDLKDITQLWTILLHLGSLQRSVAIIKPISFVVSLILENILTLF